MIVPEKCSSLLFIGHRVSWSMVSIVGGRLRGYQGNYSTWPRSGPTFSTLWPHIGIFLEGGLIRTGSRRALIDGYRGCQLSCRPSPKGPPQSGLKGPSVIALQFQAPKRYLQSQYFVVTSCSVESVDYIVFSKSKLHLERWMTIVPEDTSLSYIQTNQIWPPQRERKNFPQPLFDYHFSQILQASNFGLYHRSWSSVRSISLCAKPANGIRRSHCTVP